MSLIAIGIPASGPASGRSGVADSARCAVGTTSFVSTALSCSTYSRIESSSRVIDATSASESDRRARRAIFSTSSRLIFMKAESLSNMETRLTTGGGLDCDASQVLDRRYALLPLAVAPPAIAAALLFPAPLDPLDWRALAPAGIWLLAFAAAAAPAAAVLTARAAIPDRPSERNRALVESALATLLGVAVT